MIRCALAVLLALSLSSHTGGLGSRKRYLEAARRFELKPAATRPAWAKRTDQPLARVVWFTDLHLNRGYLPLADRAFAYMNGLRPDAILVTGDNCAYAPGDFQSPFKDKYTRRWAYFKHLLDRRLDAPTIVLPGDNWPWGYDKVYGSRQFSLDIAGVHIVCVATDQAARGIEGCAILNAETWAWLAKDLHENRDKPTLVAMHENTAPPTFLEAERLGKLLQSHPQVLATLTGHLHLDVDFPVANLRHIVCPALGPSLRHGLKEITIHQDAILLQTHEGGTEGKQFKPVEIWQRIPIPPALRKGLAPTKQPFTVLKRSSVPTHPMVEKPKLKERSAELLAPAMRFLMMHSMQALKPAWLKATP